MAKVSGTTSREAIVHFPLFNPDQSLSIAYMVVLRCRNLQCVREEWNSGPGRVSGVDFDFEEGLFYGLCGPDGCGKGLFLHLLGLMEAPDAGELELMGQPAPAANSAEAAALRSQLFGFLFSSPCLIPSLSVAENVAMPLFRLKELAAAQARDRTRQALAVVGLEDAESYPVVHLPPNLRQRVSLARAIVHDPKILIAISPRSNDLLPLARQLGRERGLTVLWAEADPADTAPYAHRVLFFEEGCLTATGIPSTLEANVGFN